MYSYAYDLFGRRVKKTASGTTTHFHYDLQGRLIAETAGDGTVLRDYIYQNGNLVAVKLHGTQAGVYYVISDHLGTPQQIVDSSGTVVWKAAFLPFGKAQVLTETIINNIRFPGQYFDAETGLHYNWNRYYDPDTGRYLTPDPIGLAGGLNLYAYVGGEPVNWIDPDGLLVTQIIKAAQKVAPINDGAVIGGMMVDGAIATGLEATGAGPNLSGKIGMVEDAMQMQGGYQLGVLGTVLAGQGYVTLPAMLSGGGGYLMGTGFNKLWEDLFGQPMGGSIYDWFHPVPCN